MRSSVSGSSRLDGSSRMTRPGSARNTRPSAKQLGFAGGQAAAVRTELGVEPGWTGRQPTVESQFGEQRDDPFVRGRVRTEQRDVVAQ